MMCRLPPVRLHLKMSLKIPWLAIRSAMQEAKLIPSRPSTLNPDWGGFGVGRCHKARITNQSLLSTSWGQEFKPNPRLAHLCTDCFKSLTLAALRFIELPPKDDLRCIVSGISSHLRRSECCADSFCWPGVIPSLTQVYHRTSVLY